MVTRHLSLPHRFVIISDDKNTRRRFKGEGDQTIPLWNDLRAEGKCLVRLKVFRPEFGEIIGPRFCWLDLDMVAVDDITPIFSRTEDFIMSGVELRPQPYNGSMLMMNSGCRSRVFDEYDRGQWQANVRGRGKRYGGSDQAWIAVKLGEREATWTREDGVFSYRDDICPRSEWAYESWKARNLVNALKHEPTGGPLPAGARIIQCNGPHGPHKPEVQRRSPWIVDHWR